MPAVVTASRNYVCVRPQTYEDEAEAKLLLSLFQGRSGVLENTVFCVLAPDGERTLTRAGRSPQQRFESADGFASWLDRTFESYARKAKPLEALPLHDGLGLALNVAACDLAPLAVLAAEDEKALEKLLERAASLAWAEDHIGRQHFVTVVGEEALAEAEEEFGLKLEPGMTLVQPDAYGRAPRVSRRPRPVPSARRGPRLVQGPRGGPRRARPGRQVTAASRARRLEEGHHLGL